MSFIERTPDELRSHVGRMLEEMRISRLPINCRCTDMLPEIDEGNSSPSYGIPPLEFYTQNCTLYNQKPKTKNQ